MSVFGAVQGWQAEMLRSFGRKQGIARAAVAQLELLVGRLDGFQGVDWRRVDRVVFVCRGNLCRSPYAEARARQIGVRASSFGLKATGGAPADPIAVRIARGRGLELAEHRSRSSSALSVSTGDLLVAMEPAQARALRPFARVMDAQVTLLGLWRWPLRAHLEDPFGLSEAYFSTCFQLIDEAVAGITRRMREAASAPEPEEATPA